MRLENQLKPPPTPDMATMQANLERSLECMVDAAFSKDGKPTDRGRSDNEHLQVRGLNLKVHEVAQITQDLKSQAPSLTVVGFVENKATLDRSGQVLCHQRKERWQSPKGLWGSL